MVGCFLKVMDVGVANHRGGQWQFDVQDRLRHCLTAYRISCVVRCMTKCSGRTGTSRGLCSDEEGPQPLTKLAPQSASTLPVCQSGARNLQIPWRHGHAGPISEMSNDDGFAGA